MTESPSRTVLLVDDDEHVLAMLHAVLASHPTLRVVGGATDGATALAMCAAHHPDVVVLDIGLPDLLGQELLTALRSTDPGIAVVVFTGHPSGVDQARRLGVDEILHKGQVGIEVLVRSLERAGAARRWHQHFGPEVASPRAARRAVVAALADWGLAADEIDTAALVVSELATNAVVHAGSGFDLSVTLGTTGLRIEVGDDGPGDPEPRRPAIDRAGGRGLLLVAELASTWGIAPSPTGKTVWAFIGA